MALTPGDCAIVRYESMHGDAIFSILLLASLSAGETLYVTDNGYGSDGLLSSSTDGTEIFTAAATVAAGTILNHTQFSDIADVSSINLRGEDQILVYTGSPDSPVFACALSCNIDAAEIP
jgi:hypothetical protein